ncbi:LPS export ABC transporter periplasmic protein LptC [Marinicella sediminis]|uniref:LPS export ABC transporter periplasmic protein LptC n=1 Tax=Marinicella sediminis TaxID=1792834 RepID=A0ABV7JBH4_9GAMM|nr:LPS export ABC transporter periplasmic protein LptC [Marinicella sediminis]
MNIERFRLRQLILFAVMALGSYAIFDMYHSKEDAFSYEPFTKGYSIEGVIIRNSDESGRIVSTIQAPSVIHYADSGMTLINQPRYRMHQADGDWLFSSESGEINEAQTELFFPQAVTLELEDVTTDRVLIETSELTINLKQKTGTSQQKLKVTQPGAVLQGVGSVIKFEQQEIEILEDLYAEFET